VSHAEPWGRPHTPPPAGRATSDVRLSATPTVRQANGAHCGHGSFPSGCGLALVGTPNPDEREARRSSAAPDQVSGRVAPM